MKLFELTNRIPVQRNPEHTDAFLSAEHRKNIVLPTTKATVKILGSGVDAVVFTVPGEIGVVKVATSRFENLQHIAYVRYAMLCKKYAGSNPYLPRVESITRQKYTEEQWSALKAAAGVDGKDYSESYWKQPAHLISVKMERLIPLAQLDESQLTALLTKTFGPNVITPDGHITASDVVYLVNAAYDGKLPAHAVLDPAAGAALRAIAHLVAKVPNTFYDLHSSNMMVRMSTGGPQLVFTDPVDTEH